MGLLRGSPILAAAGPSSSETGHASQVHAWPGRKGTQILVFEWLLKKAGGGGAAACSELSEPTVRSAPTLPVSSWRLSLKLLRTAQRVTSCPRSVRAAERGRFTNTLCSVGEGRRHEYPPKDENFSGFHKNFQKAIKRTNIRKYY